MEVHLEQVIEEDQEEEQQVAAVVDLENPEAEEEVQVAVELFIQAVVKNNL